jgi:hypothetical protein
MVKGAALLILLRGLAGRWRLWTRGSGRETGVAVHVAEDLLRCVAVGGERYLE